MRIKFKNFIITNDKRQFILRYESENQSKNYYYDSLLSLLNNLPDKAILKKESQKIDELIEELQEIKKFIDSNFNK